MHNFYQTSEAEMYSDFQTIGISNILTLIWILLSKWARGHITRWKIEKYRMNQKFWGHLLCPLLLYMTPDNVCYVQTGKLTAF